VHTILERFKLQELLYLMVRVIQIQSLFSKHPLRSSQPAPASFFSQTERKLAMYFGK
jgi:hypothetical protein